MKKLAVICAVAFLITACGNNKKKEEATQAPVNPQTLEYAGMSVFEVGSIRPGFDPNSGTVDDVFKAMRPIARVFICLEASNQVQMGTIDIDLKALGVPPIRLDILNANDLALAAFDLDKLTIDYVGKGSFSNVSSTRALGQAEIQVKARNLNWHQIFPTDRDVRKNYEHMFSSALSPKWFEQNYPQGSGGWDRKFWNVNGKSYYLLSRFATTSVLMPDIVSVLKECEQRKEKQFVVKLK